MLPSSRRMSALLGTAPVLSTPDSLILSESSTSRKVAQTERLSDAQIEIRYEIDRTLRAIKEHQWSQVALQFPDDMLPDSARVYQLLARGLRPGPNGAKATPALNKVAESRMIEGLNTSLEEMTITEEKPVKLTILADTSYGSCCVDEIAAEHVDADAVVHYGRACLSPTARLPVLHIFTRRDLDHESVIKAFTETFQERGAKIILTADVSYSNHIQPVYASLTSLGYLNTFAAAIIHDPSSSIPNRTVPDSVKIDSAELQNYQLFHISEPPTSLLLTLSSRVAQVYIYPTTPVSSISPAIASASTSSILRRRYALVTSLTTVSTWGILINTLSVKNYLGIVEHVKTQISDDGKKSYLFVMGKLNAAKVANFSEIGGWVVIGCWESSLIDSKDFYKPVITPFELELALQSDSERLWTGQWSGDFQAVLDSEGRSNGRDGGEGSAGDQVDEDYDSEEESAPPEFDLRTGKYVSRSRPFATQNTRLSHTSNSKALTKRATGDIVAMNGVGSPAAEYLRSKRTWQGLGSDFKVQYEDEEEQQGSQMQEGRSGIARGYTIGESKMT
jgi:diphthamide biosynthesis protein 2